MTIIIMLKISKGALKEKVKKLDRKMIKKAMSLVFSFTSKDEGPRFIE